MTGVGWEREDRGGLGREVGGRGRKGNRSGLLRRRRRKLERLRLLGWIVRERGGEGLVGG